ncbi:MAG: hypothetical protein NVS3B26_23400 [Mycobacteriales bacterium]
MKTAPLYRQGACAACAALTGSLTQRGVHVTVHDVAGDPSALTAALALGYRSLPVLVAADGAAAGPGALALGRRLTAPSEPAASPGRVDRAERHVHLLNDKEGTS